MEGSASRVTLAPAPASTRRRLIGPNPGRGEGGKRLVMVIGSFGLGGGTYIDIYLAS
jgi:hypothetical protein